MSSNDGSGWIKNIEIYQKHPDIEKEIDGIRVNLMHPRVLIEYKQELSREHQEQDISFLQKYIESNKF